MNRRRRCHAKRRRRNLRRFEELMALPLDQFWHRVVGFCPVSPPAALAFHPDAFSMVWPAEYVEDTVLQARYGVGRRVDATEVDLPRYLQMLRAEQAARVKDA